MTADEIQAGLKTFLEEYDFRMNGGRNTSPKGQQWLRDHRPLILLAMAADPEKFLSTSALLIERATRENSFPA